MRITFIINQFPSLSETFILNQLTGLLDMGHKVRIIAKLLPPESGIHDDVAKYGLMGRTCYIRQIPQSKLYRKIQAAAMLFCIVLKRPFATLRFVRRQLSRPEGFSYELLYYAYQLLREDSDIVHCHFGPNGNIAAELQKLGLDFKFLTTFHGYDANCYPAQAGADVYRELFERGDLFTANTNFTKQQIVKLGCNPEKIEILPVGLKIDEFIFAGRQIRNREPVGILTVGRLVPKKGYEYAIRAVAKVAAVRPDIFYTIVGEGPLLSSLKSLVAELALEKQVEFVGPVCQSRALELYQNAHIFMLPSVTADDGDKEGQALVLQEAQACGLPVLSTLHNGIPEGVLDGKSGFLVPEKNVDALAERLLFLVDNPQLWSGMGKCGREFVEKKYDIKILNEKLVQLYTAHS